MDRFNASDLGGDSGAVFATLAISVSSSCVSLLPLLSVLVEALLPPVELHNLPGVQPALKHLFNYQYLDRPSKSVFSNFGILCGHPVVVMAMGINRFFTVAMVWLIHTNQPPPPTSTHL